MSVTSTLAENEKENEKFVINYHTSFLAMHSQNDLHMFQNKESVFFLVSSILHAFVYISFKNSYSYHIIIFSSLNLSRCYSETVQYIHQ